MLIVTVTQHCGCSVAVVQQGSGSVAVAQHSSGSVAVVQQGSGSVAVAQQSGGQVSRACGAALQWQCGSGAAEHDPRPLKLLLLHMCRSHLGCRGRVPSCCVA